MLSDDTCIKYEGNDINNCKVGNNDNTVCTECDLGYVLVNNECKSISEVH